MRRDKKVFLRFLLAAGAIATPIVYGYEFGPPPGYSGAPGDNASGCAANGCHGGAISPKFTGSVSITASGGTNYIPGQAQTITVTVTDSAQKGYGFEMTAKATGTNSAGLLTAGSDGYTQVICADGSVSPAAGCPASRGSTQQWVEHTLAGWESSGTPPSHSFKFTWTPPATASGTITFYAAGNAVANAAPPANDKGAHTYFTNLALTPAAANPNAPAITPGGINPLYSTATTIQPGAWAQMYGTNLGPTGTTLWKGDFATTLGGTSVTVNGKPASLYFVSPTQLNFQAPNDTATGSVPVVVTTPNGTASAIVTLGAVAPSFLVLDGKHVTGIILRSDGSGAYGGGSYDIIGPTGNSLGYATVAAKAGDSVELFGVGFGPTNPALPSGQALAAGQYGTATLPLTLLINNQNVIPSFAGVTQAGLYQINLTIPGGLGTGDVSLAGTVAGPQTPAGVVISLQ